MKVTSLFLSLTIITAHVEKNKRKVAKDTQPPRRFFVEGLSMLRASADRPSRQLHEINFFFLSIGRKDGNNFKMTAGSGDGLNLRFSVCGKTRKKDL